MRTLPKIVDDVVSAYAYQNLKHDPIAAKHTYKIFEQETVNQWNNIVHVYTVKFHNGEHQYKSSKTNALTSSVVV